MEYYRQTCFTRGQSFDCGPHKYDGKYIKRYDICVCRMCYTANHDGWAPAYEEKILKHLSEKGITPPKRNSQGFLPRD